MIQEELISKLNAKDLFDNKLLDNLTPGTFFTLQTIHKYLFNDVFDFAGNLRTVNIAKGNFLFAPLNYLENTLQNIDKMPQSTYDEIIEKYIEMNIAHPFREGNGTSTRIWLDHILKEELNKVINWTKIDKQSYLNAMIDSPIDDTKIKELLKISLTSDINNRDIYLRGIDQSYYFEDLNEYTLSTNRIAKRSQNGCH
ncbi:MAG: Fic family protein [Erysipelotrichaceae bacterium]|nr:Fic family protein [Solobacterium sp.]MCI6878782.1 Fic family protein [Solobacterium sp.]MDY3793955.1 Fic family protein [Erysipelotrichaceae bacterium]